MTTSVWPSVAENGMTIWPQGDDKLHVRYFTIRNARGVSEEVHIDVVKHSGGMISDWAYNAKIGDLIGIMGPGGGGIPECGDEILLAGDETALPAIARILEKLHENQSGIVVASAPSMDALYSYLPKSNLEYFVIDPRFFRTECESFVSELYKESKAPSFAWFGGEFSNANSMRMLFKKEFGLAKGNQLSVSYWEDGKRGAADKIE